MYEFLIICYIDISILNNNDLSISFSTLGINLYSVLPLPLYDMSI